MNKKNGGPAFPMSCFYEGAADEIQPPGEMPYEQELRGMSLRDWFAGMALAHPYAQGDDTHMNANKAAAWAYELADAMLAEREKEA